MTARHTPHGPAWRRLLGRLFPRWFGAFDRSAFASAPALDHRTIALPMIGSGKEHTYYEVAEIWARERLRAKHHLQEILDGVTDYGDPVHAAASHACELGVWLRFLNLPAQADRVDDLRMWHDHWHQELARLISLANQGQRLKVEEAMKPARGPWTYAARRVSQLLESLWAPRAPVGLQLRRAGTDDWIDAAILAEDATARTMTLSLETELAAGEAIELRRGADATPESCHVKLCRPGQRGAQDDGVFIAYLVAGHA